MLKLIQLALASLSSKFLTASFVSAFVKIFVAYALIRFVFYLGLGFIVFTGTSYGLDWLVSQISSVFSGMPLEQRETISLIATLLRLDDCFSAIFTGISLALAYRQVRKAWVFNI